MTDPHTTPHRVDLLALAERIEKASGPDREVDDEIMAALFVRGQRYIGCQEEQDDGSWTPMKDSVWIDPKTDQWVGTAARGFTSSIDDAMTLLPPLDDKLRPLTILMGVSEDGLRFQVVLKNWQWGAIKSNDRCASYALALCSAALKAKARTGGSSHGR